ncbi:periplasmic copper-binding [Methanococcus vannielii SB]|uniref:Periplasmic copper-binding n=1 Tax=Methanococcus vannielii (strain ATCC 35089 / DSM 1224 / JCM 13029 / OCM 148 / SB) TaxID=406327 RepID=A6URR2_METVS|nr:right-handed parallel beta-helix repeat-containing protein [Methanococcus vannielii]ABR55184.1 periplasmic copper-binding [Methanococcus vannielii SB]
MKIFGIILLLLALTLIPGIYASESTIYVNNTHYWYFEAESFESNNSLQSAIDIAEEGSVILVTKNSKFFEGLKIAKNNITIDLNGSTIEGEYSGKGIAILGDGVKLKNAKIQKFEYGIFLENTKNCKILNNDVSENIYDGIYLSNSNYNEIAKNNAYKNGVIGIITAGIFLDGSDWNNVSENSANNNIYNGIELINSESNTISRNTIFENEDNGIFVWNSKNNSISENKIFKNEDNGVLIRESSYNTFLNNTLTENRDSGFYIWKSFENNLIRNEISENSINGIRLWNSESNEVSENKVLSNGKSGVSLEVMSFENMLYNNIFNNSINANFKDSGKNYWNTSMDNGTNILKGEFIGGNLWCSPKGDGFSQKAENQDSNGDMFSENHYRINSENTDFLPIAPDNTPPEVTILSPRENSIFNENETILINVSAIDNSGVKLVMVEINGDYKEIMKINGSNFVHELSGLGYGRHTLKVFATDNAGNINSGALRTFSIIPPDNTPPEVKIISPTARGYAEDTEISIKVRVTDTSGIKSVYAKVGNYNVELIESSGYYINVITGLGRGVHSLWVFATDNAGNINYNEKVTFEVNDGDTTPPKVEIIEPDNKNIFRETSVTIKVNATDESGIKSVKAVLDGKINFNMNYDGSEYYIVTINDLAYGTHSIRIYAEDNEKNINSKETLTFKIENKEELKNPINNTVDPINNTVDPINNTVDPINNTVDPINNTVDPINNTVDPINNTVDPINNTVDPINNTVDPINNTVDPINNTVIEDNNKTNSTSLENNTEENNTEENNTEENNTEENNTEENNTEENNLEKSDTDLKNDKIEENKV